MMKKMLIRAEDKNIWERRAPLVPADIKSIIRETGCEVFVEDSIKRFFKSSDYMAAGGKICKSMEPGDVIFGVKEIPVQKLMDKKIYAFFSHTIKRQLENMPMLKQIIKGGSTLIDYEKITDTQNRRKVFFGNFAGDAGALDILWLMGEYWQARGINTPFLQCRQALNYQSVDEAKQEIKNIGKKIVHSGLPEKITPLVIGIIGYGNVSRGAQSVLQSLPVVELPPDQLINIIKLNKLDSNHIYMVIFKEEHLVERKSDGLFDLQEYYKLPEKYRSIFEKYLPYLSIIINAAFWDSRYPRFVTWAALKKLYSSGLNPKLQGIADITCDINGSIECNVKTTDSGSPAYRVDPLRKKIYEGHKGDGLLLLAVDNLPAELPNDASVFFSGQLKEYIPNILTADYNVSLDKSGLHPDIQRAVVVYNGNLTTDYNYLKDIVLR